MQALTNKLCGAVHRALCYIGIHAPERIFMSNDKLEDFKPKGWLCAICTKTWEEN